jgi:hypothetical protein
MLTIKLDDENRQLASWEPAGTVVGFWSGLVAQTIRLAEEP